MELGEYLAAHERDDLRIDAYVRAVSGLKRFAVSGQERWICQIEEQIDRDVDAFADDNLLLKDIISEIREEDSRKILILRHVRMQPWKEVSGRMKLSASQVKALYEKAYLKLQEVWDNRARAPADEVRPRCS